MLIVQPDDGSLNGTMRRDQAVAAAAAQKCQELEHFPELRLRDQDPPVT